MNPNAESADASNGLVVSYDRDVFELVNQVRANPAAVIPLLEAMVATFEDGGKKVLIAPGQYLLTNEGPAAVLEAIQALQDQTPVNGLEWSEKVALASKAHAEDLNANGLTGHTGSDASSPHDRVMRFTESEFNGSGENIVFGDNDSTKSVLALIVDDGVPDRGHRKNIFNSMWTHFGCHTGPHPGYTRCTVQNFATSRKAAESAMNNTREKLEADLGEEPEGWVNKQTALSQAVQNGELVTTLKIVYKFADGSEQVLTTESREAV